MGDAVSYVGQATGVAALGLTGQLTLTRALLVMGLTSLLASAIQYWQVRPALEPGVLDRELMRAFWKLGKALIVVNGIGALTVQSLPWLLAAFAGVAAVGSYQALLTVVGFTNPLMLAVNSLITTHSAQAQGLDPVPRRRREIETVRRYVLVGGIPLVAYCLLLFSAPSTMLRLFFGSTSPYRSLTPELRVFLLFSISQYAYFAVAAVLNARQDTRSLLRAQIASALTVPLFAVPLIATHSVLGAVIAAAISAIVRTAVVTRSAATDSARAAGPSRRHR